MLVKVTAQREVGETLRHSAYGIPGFAEEKGCFWRNLQTVKKLEPAQSDLAITLRLFIHSQRPRVYVAAFFVA